MNEPGEAGRAWRIAYIETMSESKPCPICGKPADPLVRPFCSKRCADVDLHRWLAGSYAVPAVEADEGEAWPDDEVR